MLPRLLAIAIMVFLNTYLTVHQFVAHGLAAEEHVHVCAHHSHEHESSPVEDDEHCVICDVDFPAFAPSSVADLVFRPNGRMVEHIALYLEPQNKLICSWPELRGPPLNV